MNYIVFIIGDSMNNILKQFLYIIATCSIIVCILEMNFHWSWWNIFSYIISASSLIFLIYETWFWKNLPLSITHVPVLPKELKGVFKYIHPHTKLPDSKKATMHISQTLTATRIIVKTNEMKSVSISASIREENGTYILYYVYRTDPKNEFVDKNPSKYGAARIDLSQLPHCLEGTYWTTNSKGDLEFKPL